MRIPYISLLAAGALALGGCAYGDLGLGFGAGYGGFDGYYGSGFGNPYGPYGGYGTYPGYYGGFGYGVPYGWYDDYYYPGSGVYVYDSYRRPHLMSSTQRAYWSNRTRTHSVTTTGTRQNWSGFDRSQARVERQAARDQRRIEREQQRENPR
jgi:hypothetical protein